MSDYFSITSQPFTALKADLDIVICVCKLCKVADACIMWSFDASLLHATGIKQRVHMAQNQHKNSAGSTARCDTWCPTESTNPLKHQKSPFGAPSQFSRLENTFQLKVSVLIWASTIMTQRNPKIIQLWKHGHRTGMFRQLLSKQDASEEISAALQRKVPPLLQSRAEPPTASLSPWSVPQTHRCFLKGNAQFDMEDGRHTSCFVLKKDRQTRKQPGELFALTLIKTRHFTEDGWICNVPATATSAHYHLCMTELTFFIESTATSCSSAPLIHCCHF